MDICKELYEEGFANLDSAGVTIRDTAGNAFAKVALPGKFLADNATVAREVIALGDERIDASRQTKIDSNGKKVTVAKADLGSYPAARVGAKWAQMVGVSVEAPTTANDDLARQEAEKAAQAAAQKLADDLAELELLRAEKASKRSRKAKTNPVDEVSATEAHAEENGKADPVNAQ